MTEQPQDMFIDEIITSETNDPLSIDSYLSPSEWHKVTDKLTSLLPHAVTNQVVMERFQTGVHPALSLACLHNTPPTVPPHFWDHLNDSGFDIQANTHRDRTEMRKLAHLLDPQVALADQLPEYEFDLYKSMLTNIASQENGDPTYFFRQLENTLYLFPQKRAELQAFATPKLLQEIVTQIGDAVAARTDDGLFNLLLSMGDYHVHEEHNKLTQEIFGNIERMQIFFPQEIQNVKSYKRLKKMLFDFRKLFRSQDRINAIYDTCKGAWYLALLEADALEVTPKGSQLIFSYPTPSETPAPQDFI